MARSGLVDVLIGSRLRPWTRRAIGWRRNGLLPAGPGRRRLGLRQRRWWWCGCVGARQVRSWAGAGLVSGCGGRGGVGAPLGGWGLRGRAKLRAPPAPPTAAASASTPEAFAARGPSARLRPAPARPVPPSFGPHPPAPQSSVLRSGPERWPVSSGGRSPVVALSGLGRAAPSLPEVRPSADNLSSASSGAPPPSAFWVVSRTFNGSFLLGSSGSAALPSGVGPGPATRVRT